MEGAPKKQRVIEDLPIPLAQLKRPAPSPGPGGSYPMLMLGILMVLAGPVIAVVMNQAFVNRQRSYERLSQDGRPAAARVTRVEHDHGSDDESNHCKACFRFSALVSGRAAVVETCELAADTDLSELKAGETVDVVYLASDPKIVSLKSELVPPSGLDILFGIGLGLLLTIPGVFISVRYALRIRDYVRLRRHGKLADGFLFDYWLEPGDDGSLSHVAFAFMVPNAEGAEELVTCAHHNSGAYKALSLGQRTPVRYMPGAPQICELVKYPWG